MTDLPPEVIIYAAASAALLGLGLYAFVMQRHPLRRILALNIMSAAVFLILVANARRTPDAEPDPVAHALVLTGIVVAVSTSALALMLMRRVHGGDDAPPADAAPPDR